MFALNHNSVDISGAGKQEPAVSTNDRRESPVRFSRSCIPMIDLLAQFDGFKAQIDAHHDRRERLVKSSRDVTATSKKIIFALHRVPVSTTGTIVISARSVKEIADLNATLRSLFDTISHELYADDPTAAHRYSRQVSPGLQEYVESFSLHWHMDAENAIAGLPEQARSSLSSDAYAGSFASWEVCSAACAPLELTDTDYLLGIADLSGELARRAIAALSGTTSEGVNGPRIAPAEATRILAVLRDMTRHFEALNPIGQAAGTPVNSRPATREVVTNQTNAGAGQPSTDPKQPNGRPSAGPGSTPFSRELAKKVEVMRASVKKVESGLFDYLVRGRERIAGPAAPTDE
ncbi:hypothetical protein PYCC9005_004168 [Savitreella phatthalungensis]